MSSRTKSRSNMPLIVAGAVLLAFVLAVTIGIALEDGDPEGDASDVQVSGGSGEDHVGEEQRAWGETLARREAEDPGAMGAVDAPVVVVAYSDFACPFCAAWAHETQPELVERYVDSGDLRIEWREFPYLGDLSRELSLGALAAAEQDAFWEYQETVFAHQEELKSSSDPDALLRELVEESGLDPERFEEALDDESLPARVDADFLEGQRIGVSGTPAFIVNGDPVMGAQPLPVFVESIESALNAAEG
ncbi:DsbA family protein [Nocardiopsis alba]|uniref:DsbA family protein n=1 Tax=Nocardiopsis alba TaxID=53437 RepID=UPI0005A8C3A6|nr:DsbA family protein [Nocardiopsis alba]